MSSLSVLSGPDTFSFEPPSAKALSIELQSHPGHTLAAPDRVTQGTVNGTIAGTRRMFQKNDILWEEARARWVASNGIQPDPTSEHFSQLWDEAGRRWQQSKTGQLDL